MLNNTSLSAAENKANLEYAWKFVKFLTNTENTPVTEYKAGQQMRLNVTVCLIMYNEPSFENSFLNKTESDADAIL